MSHSSHRMDWILDFETEQEGFLAVAKTNVLIVYSTTERYCTVGILTPESARDLVSRDRYHSLPPLILIAGLPNSQGHIPTFVYRSYPQKSRLILDHHSFFSLKLEPFFLAYELLS